MLGRLCKICVLWSGTNCNCDSVWHAPGSFSWHVPSLKHEAEIIIRLIISINTCYGISKYVSISMKRLFLTHKILWCWLLLKYKCNIILIFWMLLQLKLRTANAERAQWRWDQDSGRNMEQWQVNTGREGTQPPPAAQPGTVSTVSCVQPRVTWVSVSVWRWPALHNNVDNSVNRQITCSCSQ